MPPRARLYLIDGHSYIYRAFHAIPGLRTSGGLPTNAVFGFIRMLLKILKEHEPEYVAVLFDPPGPTARHQTYEAYKANRPEMPDTLVPQVPYIQRAVEAFRIPALMVEGHEADDLIGSLAKRAQQDGLEVTIVTGDKDLLQLVGPHVRVYDTLKDQAAGEQEVRERFGVEPGQMVEIMGLMGDPIDNIPGVKGIGPKYATELIQEFGSIETLLTRLDAVKKPRLREMLRQQADAARMSRELATLHTDVPLEVSYEELQRSEPDLEALTALFQEMEFSTLLKELPRPQGEPAATYRSVTTLAELKKIASVIEKEGSVSVDLETTSRNPMEAEIVGIALAVRPGEAWYVPVGHQDPTGPQQIPLDRCLEILGPLLEDPGIRKIGQNLKYEWVVLQWAGIRLQGLAFDTMVAAYLLGPERRGHNLDALALEYLKHRTLTYAEVAGKGKQEIPFSQVDMATATRYAGEDADVALRLVHVLEPRLREQGLEQLYQEVELPLVTVLADMEITGVCLDVGLLHDMSKELERQTDALMALIHTLAGTSFNVNSPRQLAEVLFTKLKLPVLRRTKTGPSTDMAVLEQLALQHELPATVLEYRSLKKLKSTYVDALPRLVNRRTGRLHTSFNQTVTATGRLSSSEPNLQNIPIRTDLGRRIREAFVARPGCRLLSADYSQIELRILAQLSGDPELVQAFLGGEDIHTRTASEIFGVLPGEVTAEMRRKAKSVNFGIVYGMGDYGLATAIGVTPQEAGTYIAQYFNHHAGVRAFRELTIQTAEEQGFVTTLLGRRRAIPELQSAHRQTRQFGERTAVNTVIQGTAADLIKMAMVHLHDRLQQEGLASKMLLQIHDELLLEVPEAELEPAKVVVREEMEGVADLAVPIVAEMGVGRNWAEAH